VRYISTRDPRPFPEPHSFEEILLDGAAHDGGLYVPSDLPTVDVGLLRVWSDLPYPNLAAAIVGMFSGETFSTTELLTLCQTAYKAFRHPKVAPLKQLDERLWLLELFHGPTLAFKDLALQLLGHLFDAVLKRRNEHVTIVAATSGDTGSAAIEACRDREAIDIFVLYPHGRISEVQRRQMTTVEAPNVHAFAVDGSFDDCQDLVKALFADEKLRLDLNLSAMNSINFARIVAQIVYYFCAAMYLRVPNGAVSFAVPTGNFGNVYSGHLARSMGLPVERLVIGTNSNDILARYLASGKMVRATVETSLSPSMDIQVPSNFERLLFELKDHNGAAVAESINSFRSGGSLPHDERAWRTGRQLFSAHRVDDDLTMRTITETYELSKILIDPHTAVGVAAAREELACDQHAAPMIALACADPSKFPETVRRATGVWPDLPAPLADLMDRHERSNAPLPNNLQAVVGVLRGCARRTVCAA
jgi:threonine synthase